MSSLLGNYTLAPERELAEKLHVSRNTLRKAIATLMEEGVLSRDGYKTYIRQGYHNLARLGKIIFVAHGADGHFSYDAIERLWNMLEPLLKKKSANISLCFARSDEDFERVMPRLAQADVLILSSLPHSMQLYRQLQELRHSKKTIGVLEELSPYTQSLISLDNDAVGRLAANTLINQGCRKVFCIWELVHTNQNLCSRAKGFMNVLEEKGLGSVTNVFWVPRDHGEIIAPMRRFITQCVNEDYDGVFLLSDENIGEILAPLFANGAIPDKLKVVTTDGTNSARRHQPPIPCISHANDDVALQLFDYLCDLAAGKKASVIIKVRPMLQF